MIVSGAESPERGRDLERFNVRKDKALATILLALDPSLLYLIGHDPVDPVAVWKKTVEPVPEEIVGQSIATKTEATFPETKRW